MRGDDCGALWEHLVLDTLLSLSPRRPIHFWRDKQQREVDFVLPRGRGGCDAVECKWRAAVFEPRGLSASRDRHRHGRNLVVSPQAGEPYSRRVEGLEVTFASATPAGAPGLRA